MAHCRCGAPASKKCSACGGEIANMNGARICQRHPAVDVATIRCLHCNKALCFWHYVLQPTVNASGRAVLGQVCFPSCQHQFKVAEARPRAVSA
jgi:hypothetical protein